MSETRAVYDVGNTKLTTKAAFRRLDCVKPYGHQNYRPPTHHEVAALLSLTGWSPKHVAQALGMSWNEEKGNGTLRKWKTSGVSNLQIPYTPWRLMLIYAGIVSPDLPQHVESIS